MVAGFIQHTFDVPRGYAEVSINRICRELRMARSSAIRARDLLIQRGWLQVFERLFGPGKSNRTLRYSLAGGPEDLDLSNHSGGGADEPT